MEKGSVEATKDQLVTSFRRVVTDAEALLKAAARQGGDEMNEVRARAEESLRDAKARLAEERAALLDRTRDAARATDAYIHENPWQVIGVAAGIAAGIGLVIGLLTGRR